MKPNRSQRPTTEQRRKSSTLHYQTFPTKPPTSKGAPPTRGARNGSQGTSSSQSEGSGERQETPLPMRQLTILAVIALAEQTALNSISPYLPDMAASFPGVKDEQVGLSVGLIASSYALAQFATNFFWGYLSDRIGRKPVVLTGTFLTASCFMAFGFCRKLWQAVLVQILMGLVNGNQGVISTCLGELTDRTNQSKAFQYLPVVYGLGAITGPMVGGLLVRRDHPFKNGQPNPYPYLLPNLFSAVVLLVDWTLALFFLEESLEDAKNLPTVPLRMGNLFAWLWQFTGLSTRPTYLRKNNSRPTSRGDSARGSGNDHDAASEDEESTLFPENEEDESKTSDVLTRDIILLLVTYFFFQLVNIAFNSLYPIFGQANPPQGRDLEPEEIGISLAFAGAATILFQIFIYGKLRAKIGNKTTYRSSLGIFTAAFLLVPWVGYKTSYGGGTKGKIILWIELGVVLVLKTVASVGGLASALLLITNSAPTHQVLGRLNGLAQTLSAAGRAAGPLVSGALFSAATRVQPRGEALAFGVFGGIAFVGFLMSFGIRGAQLEAEWDSSDDEEEAEDGGRASESMEDEEERPLLR